MMVPDIPVPKVDVHGTEELRDLLIKVVLKNCSLLVDQGHTVHLSGS